MAASRLQAVILLGFLATIPPADLIAEPVVKTTLCDIERRPQDFDGKMVRVRARVLSGFEVFAIRDGDCGDVWLAYPQVVKRDRAFARFEKLLEAEMYPRHRNIGCMSCSRYEVTATLIGRLDYAGEGKGFGHLNGYPARLMLQSVADVSAKDFAPEYDATEYSTTPVRFPAGTIEGTLLTAAGEPLRRQHVFAIDTGPEAAQFPREVAEFTDDKGRFRIEVPPGIYVVGINTLWSPSTKLPYARTYFPGVNAQTAARQFHIRDREELSLELRLGPPLVERQIPVSVTWPDGRPVARANVWLEDVEYGEHNVVGISVSHTDANGRFTLVGYEGRDYIVHATIHAPRPYCAPTHRINAHDPTPAVLSMTLTIQQDCR